jgi:hypothetical protein
MGRKRAECIWLINKPAMLNKCKYLFSLILVLHTFNYLNGQNLDNPVSPGKMLTGTWQWANCKDTFTIQLFCIDTLFQSNVTTDMFGPQIYGWHRFVENGVLIENSFPSSLPQVPFSKGIFGMVMNNKDFLLWFRDITRERDFRVAVEFLDSTATLMKWTTHRPQERVWYPLPKPKIWEGQTIPSPIIMHKISDD